MTDTPQKWWYVFDEPTRILVVDDDPILREFASVYLTTPKSEVVAVPDAATALDVLSKEIFDIAMIDIEMPGMDGFELAERIRAHAKLSRLPIVMVTGREDIVSIDRAYTAGATSFATKPVNWRQLSHQLRYVIRASRSQADEQHHARRTPATPPAHSVAWMSDATRREFATSLGSIINAAKRHRERPRVRAARLPRTSSRRRRPSCSSLSWSRDDGESRALTFIHDSQ